MVDLPTSAHEDREAGRGGAVLSRRSVRVVWTVRCIVLWANGPGGEASRQGTYSKSTAPDAVDGKSSRGRVARS